MKNRTARLTRRRFLRDLAIVNVAAPVVISSSVLGLAGAVAPSNRIAMGLIGCGGHGTSWNLDRMFENPDQQVVAVCDVDSLHLAAAEEKVNSHYSKLLGREYRCQVYADFRELVNRKDIDAVDVATPDHWHVIPSIMALKAGKHVICEKPLTLTVREGRILADEAKRSGLVFQTASENRSIDSFIQICELVNGGYIGGLRKIEVLLPTGNESRGNDDFTLQEPPEYLDYEMWQGQAQAAPYCSARVHNTFRWNLAYSGGRLTDWGAHLIDLAQWASGYQHTGPVEVEGTGIFPPRAAVWNTAVEFDLQYRYANGVLMNVRSEEPGIRFEGDDGWVMFKGWRGPLEASDPKILTIEIPRGRQLHRPKTLATRVRGEGVPGGEHLDFTECIKNGGETYSPAETGHRTITIAHIGNIAMLLGRKLDWSPEQERFPDDEEASALLSREERKPWTIANIDSWLNVG